MENTEWKITDITLVADWPKLAETDLEFAQYQIIMSNNMLMSLKQP